MFSFFKHELSSKYITYTHYCISLSNPHLCETFPPYSLYLFYKLFLKHYLWLLLQHHTIFNAHNVWWWLHEETADEVSYTYWGRNTMLEWEGGGGAGFVGTGVVGGRGGGDKVGRSFQPTFINYLQASKTEISTLQHNW